MKNRGFTLIELLAVIVILAIIALIATPIILNIINDAKESANQRSKDLYLSSVELEIAKKNLKEGFNPTTCTVNEDGGLTCDVGELKLETKGTKPKAGGTIIFNDGKIVSNTLEFENESNANIVTPILTKVISGGNEESREYVYEVTNLYEVDGIEIYKSTEQDNGYQLNKKLTKTELSSQNNRISLYVEVGQKVYYKVRSYKEINGKEAYSSYTDVITVKYSDSVE